MFFLNKELSFWEIRDLKTRKSVDKYLLPRIFRLNIFIHNEFSKCGRMAGWGTQDPRHDLKLSCLDSSCMALIRQANLGCFMMRARRRVNAGAEPIK